MKGIEYTEMWMKATATGLEYYNLARPFLINPLHKKIATNRTKDIVHKLNEILVGYYHYYGITDNSRSNKSFRYEVLKSLYYWLNRRSQKKSYNWADFLQMIDICHPLAKPKVYVSIYA